MEAILIGETGKTPFINFDGQNGILEIKGKSIPENPIEFYEPLWDWLDEYINNAPPKIKTSVQLKYINSSSLKCLITIFKKLKELKNKNESTEITINWYYGVDDEDMYDTGKECEELTGIPFNMIETED